MHRHTKWTWSWTWTWCKNTTYKLPYAFWNCRCVICNWPRTIIFRYSGNMQRQEVCGTCSRRVTKTNNLSLTCMVQPYKTLQPTTLWIPNSRGSRHPWLRYVKHVSRHLDYPQWCGDLTGEADYPMLCIPNRSHRCASLVLMPPHITLIASG